MHMIFSKLSDLVNCILHLKDIIKRGKEGRLTSSETQCFFVRTNDFFVIINSFPQSFLYKK